MDTIQQKIIKHRSTCAPLECARCGYIWYGWTTHHRLAPEGVLLCDPCWKAFDDFTWEKYESREERESVEAFQVSQDWLEDKSHAPYPRSAKRRFHRSVPGWMRSAIETGMVRTNGTESYVVYSQEQVAIKADIAH